MDPLGRTGLGAPLVVFGTTLMGCGLARDGTPDGLFEDVTAELGLPAPDGRWPDGTHFLPEIMQGGIGLFDADGDGDLDLAHVRVPPPGSSAQRITNKLHRHEAGRFVDVSAEAGLVQEGFGQGLAVGDADNDGDLELYVTNLGADVYYENDGTGRFSDASAAAGFGGDGWSTAAAFCDYDADGFQDLYVVHYLRYDAGKRCTDPSERPEYCGPRSFNGAPDTLYRNRGDGTFEDVTRAAGIVLPQAGARATGLGIVFADLTRDGRPDVFVANDAQANQLWVNKGDGRFADEGIQRGVALDPNGRTEANMGVAVGDANGDGALDLFVTHLWEENNRLYLGTPGPIYRDGTVASGLSRHDLERTGFGCGFFDFDPDGDEDLAVVNGAVRKRPALPGAPVGFWSEYAEPNQLFENDGAARFTLADDKAGTFAAEVEVSRGLAFGDLDADGDLDLVLSNVDNRLRAYRNDAPTSGTHWVFVRPMTRGRDALGAEVRLRACGREIVRVALASYGYGSSNDPRAHFGLGTCASLDEITVTWPDGVRESFPGAPADREIVLRQGEGKGL
jgi:enediyne biosynthesis protein E4